ncbi:MAG: radical SAM protein [Candidatus Diapherotrites archaeon]
MKLVFLQSDPFTKVGVMTISAVLKAAGHETGLFIDSAEKNIVESALNAKPDVVAFSGASGAHHWDFAKAREIKEKAPKVKVLFGGPHATYYPEIIEEKFIDFVCVGEGEYAIRELLDALEKGKDASKIKNIWVKKGKKVFRNPLRKLVEDLDLLPFPDRDLYYKYDFLKKQPKKDFLFSRGCPYQCTFCFNQDYKRIYEGRGKYVRFVSPMKAIEEIKAARDAYGLERLMIHDDLFIMNKKWFDEFIELYKKEVNLPFSCLARADLVTEEIAKKLREAGCSDVAVGIESGDEFVRNEVLKKNLKEESIIRGAALIKKNKMMLKTFNMMCMPGETLEAAWKTIDLNIKIKADFAWCSVLKIYPKTWLANYAIENGYLDKDFSLDEFGDSYILSPTPIKLKGKDRILNLQRFVSITVNFPFLKPLVKQLIKLPPNRLFNFLLQIEYALLTIKTSQMGLMNFIDLGRRTRGYLVDERKKEEEVTAES